jgi:hypothetical protein
MMVILLGAKLRHEAIGFFAQFMQNAGAFSQHVRILRVFTAKLFGRGVVEKRRTFARVRNDELVADLLVMGHRRKTGASRGVEFLQAHDGFDIEQVQTGLQEPIALLRIVRGRPTNGGDCGHLTFHELREEFVHALVVRSGALFEAGGGGRGAFFEEAEDLPAPLPLLFMTLMIAENERRVDADENDDKLRETVENDRGPTAFRGIVHEPPSVQ